MNGKQREAYDDFEARSGEKVTQYEAIKAALLRGDQVNPVEAAANGWGLRLAAHIHKARKEGWPVKSEFDHQGRAYYRLPDGWTPPDIDEGRP